MTYRVLMVEEEAAIAAELAAALQQRGFELKRVISPDEVVEAARLFKPHILVLDASPAEGDSFTLLRSLRSHALLREASDAPLLAIASSAEDEERLVKLGLTAEGFATRPLSGEDLASHIETLLHDQATQKTRRASVSEYAEYDQDTPLTEKTGRFNTHDLSDLPPALLKEQVCVLVARVITGNEDDNQRRVFERIGECLDCVRDSVSRFGGHTFRQVGPELVAFFRRTGDGANAACDMQEAVARPTRATALTASLQIGLHVGEVFISAGDVFGDALTQATRIARLAHPGQILHTTALNPVAAGTQGARPTAPHSLPAGDRDVMELQWQSDFTSTQVMGITDAGSGKSQVLHVRHRDKQYLINAEHPVLMIGRDPSADIQISHLKASRMHAWLQLREDGFYLIDKSSNGTAVLFADQAEFTILHKQVRLRARGCLALGQFLKSDQEDVVYFEIGSPP